MKRIILTFLMALTLMSHQVSAASMQQKDIGEAYALPVFRELAQTLILLGGLDVNDPKVIQEYAKLIYCEVYKEKFKSDFEWNNVKREITSRLLEKKEMYRLRYEIHGKVKLDRYNFEGQYFPLDKKSKLTNVGTMVLMEAEEVPTCDQTPNIGIIPPFYYILLSQPLTIDSLKMPMDEAEKFLAKMDELKINDRSLFIRFRFKIVEVARVSANNVVVDDVRNIRADFLGKIMQIDFFFDREMTKWAASIPVTAK